MKREDTNINNENWENIVIESRENAVPHNPYGHESRKLECIATGDIEGLILCQQEKWFGKLGKVGDDELRQERNMGIIVIVLASRAAIKGGLLPEKAFSMADGYILNFEHTYSVDEIRKMIAKYEICFAKEVNQINSNVGNYYIRAAKEYIYLNLHQKILVSDIADRIKITPDYLSRIFYENEGISLSQYILNQRLDEAKYLLKYTDLTLEQISFTLSFTNQSYFGKMFKKNFHITPGEFRRQNKIVN